MVEDNTIEEQLTVEAIQDILKEGSDDFTSQRFSTDNIFVESIRPENGLNQEEKQSLYKKFRDQYGESPNREQIKEFYNKSGIINCSLTADWVADYLKEKTGVIPKKISIANFKNDDNDYPDSDSVVHAMLEVKFNESTFFYDPTSKNIFNSTEEITKYMQTIFPQPGYYNYAIAYLT